MVGGDLHAPPDLDLRRGPRLHPPDTSPPAAPPERAAGDPLPPDCVVIEVYVGQLKQLFNAMDPSPFREKDLDPNAEEFIVGWAREAPARSTLGLRVHLDRQAGDADEAALLRDAIHEFFGHRAETARRRLRQLFRRGRTSLVIGLVFLTGSIVAGEFAADAMGGGGLADVVRESLLIGGWVAMWRPLEVFLYDWWPIRAEIRLLTRLGAMPVRISYRGVGAAADWRSDWPATPVPAERAARKP
jgi:hypothetical protein